MGQRRSERRPFMKIAVYCQHVLGIGHLHRAVELCRAFSAHGVLLITGGPPAEADLPNHVRQVQLPPLKMGRDFGGLVVAGSGSDLEEVKRQRREKLIRLFAEEQPDCLILELYPFGRKAFRFELDPLLEAINSRAGHRCGVFSSVRDILVEKDDARRHEARAVDLLNRYFDGVLIHADPRLVRLEETFDRIDEIDIPLVYTGYIAARPPQNARRGLRRRLGLSDGTALVVASAGGGQVGTALLQAAVKAANLVATQISLKLVAFTGPFMSAEDRRRIKRAAGSSVVIKTFSKEFLSYLAAADLSISMAGYNTIMNILSTAVPALVFPFTQNREQRLRADRLASRQALKIIDEIGLKPESLAVDIMAELRRPPPPPVAIDLDGAAHTVRWIEQWRRNQAS